MTELSVDFIVVGAGVAGLSVAHELAAHGRVAVAEQESAAGYHSTGRSAAIFVESYGNAVVRVLNSASRAFFEHSDFAAPGTPLLNPRGVLYFARVGAPQEAAGDAWMSLPRLTAEEARALVPIFRPDSISHAFYEEGAADIDVHALQTGYLKSIRQRNGVLLTNAAVTGAVRKGSNWHVTAGSTRLTAPIVVNAAGAWAANVGRLFGAAELTLTPKRRTAVIVAPPAGVDVSKWPLSVDLNETFYFKPEAGNLMLSPADETPCDPHDAYPDEMDVAVAIDRFEQVVNYSVQRVSTRWAGLRTFAPDRALVIGFDVKAEGFFWLAGQGGYGVQTAPAASRLARQLILDQAIEEDLREVQGALSPGRFSA